LDEPSCSTRQNAAGYLSQIFSFQGPGIFTRNISVNTQVENSTIAGWLDKLKPETANRDE
jgi:hypothetical protein